MTSSSLFRTAQRRKAKLRLGIDGTISGNIGSDAGVPTTASVPPWTPPVVLTVSAISSPPGASRVQSGAVTFSFWGAAERSKRTACGSGTRIVLGVVPADNLLSLLARKPAQQRGVGDFRRDVGAIQRPRT